MKNLSPFFIACLLCGSALSLYAAAEDQDEPSSSSQPASQPKHHQPSPQAINACNGLAVKDSCQFNGRNNDLITGVCAAHPSDSGASTLACRPNHWPKKNSSAAPTP